MNCPACCRCWPRSRTRAGGEGSGTCSYSCWRSRWPARWQARGTSGRSGDHAADLPQGLLARLGGRPHPLLRQIIAPSEKRIRTLLQQIDAAKLDEVTGCWLRSLADAGRLDGPAAGDRDRRQVAARDRGRTAGEAVRRDAAPGKGGHRPARDPRGHQRDHPGQGTAGPGGPGGAVVTGDAAHAQRETAAYMAGPEDEGGRGADYFLFVKGNQPGVQRAVYDLIQARAPRPRSRGDRSRPRPDHQEVPVGHRRQRPGLPARQPGSPDPPRRLRRRRKRRPPKRSCMPSPAWTKTAPPRGPSPDRPRPVGHRISALGPRHRVREDAGTGYTGAGPQVLATCRNIAISLLYLAGVTHITRTLQAIGRDRTRLLGYLPL